MKRRLVASLAVVAGHVVLCVLGAASHTSILSGMPRSPLSIVLGPLTVVLALGTFVVVPIACIAMLLELVVARLRSTRSSARAPSR